MTCPTCHKPLTVERFRREDNPADNGNALTCDGCDYTAWVPMAEIEAEKEQAREARAEAVREMREFSPSP
jgi:RNase P subunit RPR2